MSQSGEFFDLWLGPVGWIGTVVRDNRVVRVFVHPDPRVVSEWISSSYPSAMASRKGVLGLVRKQVDEYFQGRRKVFEIPLSYDGISDFKALVLQSLARVPLGVTVTYGELAMRLGRPAAARAVGRALATNPFPIIVPCHRVLGGKGGLTGYSAGEGIETKKWLLEFESGQT